VSERSPGWTPPTLEAEPPLLSVADADVASAWAAAYSRLVDFERGILAQMRGLRDHAAPALYEMIEASNIAPIEELISVFAAREEAWIERANRLRGSRGGS
jgi:hypothetical protein